MSKLTEYQVIDQEDIMTPKHSIPSTIHCLYISGSKGHFASEEATSVSLATAEKTIVPSRIPTLKSQNGEKTAQPPKSTSNFRIELTPCENLQWSQQEETVKPYKNLTRVTSLGFLQPQSSINRAKSSLKERESKRNSLEGNQNTSHQCCVGKKTDVVSRLLRYGESIRLKNEEMIKKKKEKEEEELRQIMSVKKKFRSERDMIVGIVGNAKDKKLMEHIEAVKNITPLRSSNSPEKIIQKITNIGKNSRFSTFIRNCKQNKHIFS